MNYFKNQFKRKVAHQVKQHCSIFLFCTRKCLLIQWDWVEKKNKTLNDKRPHHAVRRHFLNSGWTILITEISSFVKGDSHWQINSNRSVLCFWLSSHEREEKRIFFLMCLIIKAFFKVLFKVFISFFLQPISGLDACHPKCRTIRFDYTSIYKELPLWNFSFQWSKPLS